MTTLGIQTGWRNGLANGGQTGTCNQLFMPETTSPKVELTCLQGFADLEGLEGYRQVLSLRISYNNRLHRDRFPPLRVTKSEREPGIMRQAPCNKENHV